MLCVLNSCFNLNSQFGKSLTLALNCSGIVIEPFPRTGASHQRIDSRRGQDRIGVCFGTKCFERAGFSDLDLLESLWKRLFAAGFVSEIMFVIATSCYHPAAVVAFTTFTVTAS